MISLLVLLYGAIIFKGLVEKDEVIRAGPLSELNITIFSVVVTWVLLGSALLFVYLRVVNRRNILALSGFYIISILYANIFRARAITCAMGPTVSMLNATAATSRLRSSSSSPTTSVGARWGGVLGRRRDVSLGTAPPRRWRKSSRLDWPASGRRRAVRLNAQDIKMPGLGRRRYEAFAAEG